ncbi:hypothetical protein [Parapedobacter sp. DT-150]|uniref:hypothetical protein n=1 Tax=Parapedobacter sp. DT-150 TaxID=3396162 RepID=UPI003F1CFFDE
MNISITEVVFFSAEVACFLTALYCLRHDPSSAWRLHRWYMGIVIVVELGGILIKLVFDQSTHHWYNGYLLIECAFISWFLFRCIRRFRTHSWRWLYGWYIVFAVIYLIDTFTIKRYALNNNSMQVMNAVFVVGSLYYYFLLQRSPTYRRLSMFADFWWVNGVMYFYFSTSVLYLFIPALGKAYLWGMPLFYLLNTLLIVIYYSTWIYAYLVRYKGRKTSPASSSS